MSGTPRSIAVWGSCVTRDSLEVGEHPFAIQYHARTSWVSQASALRHPGAQPPIPVPDGAGFGHRMVREDLVGDVVERIVAAQPDVLAIDLIDERFDTVRVGERWYTMSDYYGRLDLEQPVRDQGEQVVAYRAPERQALFRDAVSVIAPRLLEELPQTRIVLHQAWYTARSADPAAGSFYATATKHAMSSNQALAGWYAALRSAFGRRLHVVEPSRSEHLVGDPAHKWGLSHFHYVPGYYDHVLAELNRVPSAPVRLGRFSRRPSRRPPKVAELEG